jgi:hypothetical protein
MRNKIGAMLRLSPLLGGGARVCTLAVEYTDVETKLLESSAENIRIQYVKPDKAPKEPNEDVRKQLLLIEASKIQKEAQEKANQGQFGEARNILNSGIKFVQENGSLMVNAEPVMAMFQNMVTNCSDSHTYRTKGVKMAISYRYAMSTGRSASADMLGDMYLSETQANVLKAFTGATVDPNAVSGSLNSSSTSFVLSPDPDDEEQKKA